MQYPPRLPIFSIAKNTSLCLKMSILLDRTEVPFLPQQTFGIQRSWHTNCYFRTLNVFEETQIMVMLQSGRTEIQGYNIQKLFWPYFSVMGNNNQ